MANCGEVFGAPPFTVALEPSPRVKRGRAHVLPTRPSLGPTPVSFHRES